MKPQYYILDQLTEKVLSKPQEMTVIEACEIYMRERNVPTDFKDRVQEQREYPYKSFPNHALLVTTFEVIQP